MGIAVFMNGCLVSWISKAQKAISLSSSEAFFDFRSIISFFFNIRNSCFIFGRYVARQHGQVGFRSSHSRIQSEWNI